MSRSPGSPTRSRPIIRTLGVGVLALGLGACGGSDSDEDDVPAAPQRPANVQVSDASARCAALAGTTVPATSIGLPTAGATVNTAALQAADAATGAPEYCRVQGDILALTAADPAIRFQLNLPSNWNVKTLQFGGGGFNGSVVTGVGGISSGPAGAPTPLARGYVTYGGDSGHQTPGATFFLNDQATLNYGGESVKRTRDAALAVLSGYYARAPWKQYYQGGSKGGQEGLHAMQRYGDGFDGVVAYYPAAQNQSLVLSWYRMWQAAYRTPGGYLNRDKQALLKAKVMESCDALDGLADGIVSNTSACKATFNVGALRCAGGTDTGTTCLSDAQIATMQTGANPMAFDFPLANGVTGIGAYPVYQGGDLTAWLDAAGTGTATSYYGFVDGTIKYFFYRDGTASSDGFDYRTWQPRVEQMSRIYDASNPDVDTFRSRGGKLLLVQGTTDMLVPESMTSAYFSRLSQRYGADLASFARYYVVPGFAHGGGDFRSSWDSLAALEAWVEDGTPPSAQVTVDANAATRGRARPLCEYPTYPRYAGTGDPTQASSFSCAAP
jgi:hypothetical protein